MSDQPDDEGFPQGNSVEAALRRLRKSRSDLHARVLSGEMTANAAMVQAGFRKPKPRAVDPHPDFTRLCRAWERAGDDDRLAFVRWLRDNQKDAA